MHCEAQPNAPTGAVQLFQLVGILVVDEVGLVQFMLVNLNQFKALKPV